MWTSLSFHWIFFRFPGVWYERWGTQLLVKQRAVHRWWSHRHKRDRWSEDRRGTGLKNENRNCPGSVWWLFSKYHILVALIDSEAVGGGDVIFTATGRKTKGEKWTHKQRRGRSGWVSFLCQRGPWALLLLLHLLCFFIPNAKHDEELQEQAQQRGKHKLNQHGTVGKSVYRRSIHLFEDTEYIDRLLSDEPPQTDVWERRHPSQTSFF